VRRGEFDPFAGRGLRAENQLHGFQDGKKRDHPRQRGKKLGKRRDVNLLAGSKGTGELKIGEKKGGGETD